MKELKGVLAISGKPGLYTLIAQTRGGIVVESLSDKKRTNISAQTQVNALGEIAIYTTEGEKPLQEIYESMSAELNNGPALSHKGSSADIVAFFTKHVPHFDMDRVYLSDMKKVVQWYNALHSEGFFTGETEVKKPKTKKPTAKKVE